MAHPRWLLTLITCLAVLLALALYASSPAQAAASTPPGGPEGYRNLDRPGTPGATATPTHTPRADHHRTPTATVTPTDTPTVPVPPPTVTVVPPTDTPTVPVPPPTVTVVPPTDTPTVPISPS